MAVLVLAHCDYTARGCQAVVVRTIPQLVPLTTLLASAVVLVDGEPVAGMLFRADQALGDDTLPELLDHLAEAVPGTSTLFNRDRDVRVTVRVINRTGNAARFPNMEECRTLLLRALLGVARHHPARISA